MKIRPRMAPLQSLLSMLLMLMWPMLSVAGPLCLSTVAEARQLLTTDNPFVQNSPESRPAKPSAQPTRPVPTRSNSPAAQTRSKLSPDSAETVSINRADAATLAQALIGIGPTKAAAIVQYRQQHGPFRQLSDLDAVKGIGPATLEKNRSRIRFD